MAEAKPMALVTPIEGRGIGEYHFAECPMLIRLGEIGKMGIPDMKLDRAGVRARRLDAARPDGRHGPGLGAADLAGGRHHMDHTKRTSVSARSY